MIVSRPITMILTQHKSIQQPCVFAIQFPLQRNPFGELMIPRTQCNCCGQQQYYRYDGIHNGSQVGGDVQIKAEKCLQQNHFIAIAYCLIECTTILHFSYNNVVRCATACRWRMTAGDRRHTTLEEILKSTSGLFIEIKKKKTIKLLCVQETVIYICELHTNMTVSGALIRQNCIQMRRLFGGTALSRNAKFVFFFTFL